jgi:predicted extracellular nuclease
VADGTVLSNDLQTISTPLVGTGNELTLTLTVVADGGSEGFAFQNLVIEGGGGASGPPFGTCGDDTETLIHDVQGTGLASPVAGTSQVVEGVVVGDFQDTTTELGGFFIQEEDTDADADPATSEGLFIADNGFGVDVAVGDIVRTKGNVSEAGTLTQLSGISDVEICTTQSGVASAAAVTLPVASVDVFETTEGMSVSFSQMLYASGNFTQARFGEVDLSAGGPLDNPTNVVAPGAPAIALQDLNDRSRIQLDDGSRVENPLPLPPYLGSGNTLRTGDTLPGLTAVMSFAGVYELQPTGPITFARANPRLDPPVVGGSITVAAYNVLNYYTTLDNAGPICGPLGDQGCRGADNVFEFDRQRAKLVTAISKLDADIVGLMEIENGPADVPTADLVSGLNDATAPGTYDYVATGAVGTDAIRVAIIYKPASVTPVGPFAVLDSSVDPNFIDTKNRPVVAQTFQENGTDDIVTVAVNHLKSKGSDCNDVGDPDLGDGQGNCNGTRDLAAQAMVDWLATDPTGAGGDQYLIIGDLNSYAQEDPIVTIENGGYTDLIEAFAGTGYSAGAYSFNFFSQSGYLDHGLASAGVLPRVTGAAFWHVNADEPSGLDYNDFNQPDLFNPDEFRSSDHDPVLIGLCETTAPVVDVTVTPDSMWPPNHKLVDVAATVTVTDADPNTTITLVSVTSNEPDNGLGDGDTAGDIVIVDDFNFELRAERAGGGEGRVYTITYEVTDACGNSTIAAATVTVPRNQR